MKVLTLMSRLQEDFTETVVVNTRFVVYNIYQVKVNVQKLKIYSIPFNLFDINVLDPPESP